MNQAAGVQLSLLFSFSLASFTKPINLLLLSRQRWEIEEQQGEEEEEEHSYSIGKRILDSVSEEVNKLLCDLLNYFYSFPKIE